MRPLEIIVAVEIGEIIAPLGGPLPVHIAHRIGALDFEDADSTRGVRVGEDKSIGRGTQDFVSEHPDPGWFHDTYSLVLIRIDRHRLMIHTSFDGSHVIQILRTIELVSTTLEIGWVALTIHTYCTHKLRSG